MELLSVQRARSAWLLHLSDLNPRGKSIAGDLIEWLGDAYNFSKKPSSVNDLDESKALAFTQGEFQIREEIFITVDLRVYNDGLVADTQSSTEDTDRFLQDVLNTFSTEFNVTIRQDTVRRKLYYSELNVRTDKNLGSLNAKLTQFTTKLAEFYGLSQPNLLEPAGIAFWVDNMPPSLNEFRLERKLGSSFSEHRYWSKAALQTAQHLQALDLLEEILAPA